MVSQSKYGGEDGNTGSERSLDATDLNEGCERGWWVGNLGVDFLCASCFPGARQRPPNFWRSPDAIAAIKPGKHEPTRGTGWPFLFTCKWAVDYVCT